MPDGDSIVSDADPEPAELQPEVSLKKRKGGAAAMRLAEEVYALYPRKIGKDAALRAISKRLDAGFDPERLMQATRLFAAAVDRWPSEDRQFVPHPATWFNQGRFEDDPAEWRRDPSAGQKKNGGVAAAAPVRQVVEPDWDWRVVWRQLWPQSEPPGELVRFGHLEASVRFELRQEWVRGQEQQDL
jgi:hypothetical protein